MPRWTHAAAGLLLAAAAACTPPAPAADVAARIGDARITLDQVDAEVRRAEPETWQALFDARSRALSRLVDDRLLAAEAAREGIAVDSLVARHVAAGLPAVSDDEVQTFFQQNERRMGGQPLAAMQDRIRQFLEDRQFNQARYDYVDGLRQRAGVEILLEPPRVRIDVTDDEPARGPADAPVVLVEYSDFQCPYCVRAQPTVEQVLQTYGDRIRFVYRDFPLDMHEHAYLAAQAGQCAAEQGRFWEYHDVLFANSRALRQEDLQRYAADLGLEAAAFSQCLDSGRFAAGVDADLASGQGFGVSGTPAFFINGRMLSGAQPFAAFQEIIDEELARSGTP